MLLDGIAIEHADPPGVRPQQPAGQADGGRLAGAVGTDQAEHFAARDLERDGVERFERSVLLGDLFKADGGHYDSGISASTGMPGFRTPARLSVLTLIR